MDLYTISTDEAGSIMITDAAGDRGILGMLTADGDAPEELINDQLGKLVKAVIDRDAEYHGAPALPRDTIVRVIDADGKIGYARVQS